MGKFSANLKSFVFKSLDAANKSISFGLFSQTASSIPITGTTTETTLLDGGVGGLVVPPNGFSIGDSFSLTLGGIISSVNNESLNIKLKSNSVILASSGNIILPNITTKHWDLEVIFTVRAVGIATVAAIMTKGVFTYSRNASNNFEGVDFSFLNNTSFDTTVLNSLDITAQWGSNNAGNNIYSEVCVLSKIY